MVLSNIQCLFRTAITPQIKRPDPKAQRVQQGGAREGLGARGGELSGMSKAYTAAICSDVDHPPECPLSGAKWT